MGGGSVRVCEERSDELRERVYGVSSLCADTSVRNVVAAGFDTITNAINTSSLATHFAWHRRKEIQNRRNRSRKKKKKKEKR